MRQVEHRAGDQATDQARDQTTNQDRRDRWTDQAARRLRRALMSIATFSLYVLVRFNRDGCFAASGALHRSRDRAAKDGIA